MPRLELFPFRFRDPLTGKWKRTRYVAERHVIAERHAEFEIIGPPEIRDVDPNRRMHNPELQRLGVAPRPKKDPPDEEPPIKDPPPQEPPVDDPPGEDPATLNGLERFLLLVFLRRHITYCARRRRFAAMEGAARLYAELRTPVG